MVEGGLRFDRAPLSSKSKEKKATVDAELAKNTKVPVIGKYRPEYLGSGGNQVVFDVAGREGESRNVVVKADKRQLANTIREQREAGRPIDQVSPTRYQELIDQSEVEQATLEEARAYFGDAILREHRYVQQVPVTKEMLRAFGMDDSGFGDNEVKKIWTIVRVQEKLPPEALEASALSLNAGYIDRQKYVTDLQLAHWTKDLVDGKAETAERYLEHLWPGFKRFRELLKDESFAAVARTFVKTAITYTQETGEIMDLVGKNNVVFYQKNGQWKIVAPDMQYGSDTWNLSRQILSRKDLESVQDRNTAVLFLNSLHYARFINALAAYLDIPSRVRVTHKPKEDRMYYSLVQKTRKEMGYSPSVPVDNEATLPQPRPPSSS